MGGRCWRVDRQSADERRLQARNGTVRAALSVRRRNVRPLLRHRRHVLRCADDRRRRLQRADVRRDPRPRRPHAAALDRGVAAHRRPAAAHRRHAAARRRIVRCRLDAVGGLRLLRRLHRKSRSTTPSHYQSNRKSTAEKKLPDSSLIIFIIATK